MYGILGCFACKEVLGFAVIFATPKKGASGSPTVHLQEMKIQLNVTSVVHHIKEKE